MRVHVVTAHNRHIYSEEMEAMHRHRHDLFVDQMGWRALESPDGLDIDEFDNEHATYLIAIDAQDRVVGSGRLMPSWRPHMLKTLFPEYSAGPVPVGPDIWEWTRHAGGGRGFTREDNLQIQYALNLAVLEFAASRGIEAYTGILETRILAFAGELGWRSQPLGLPRNYGEGTAVALFNPIWPGQLAHLRRIARRQEPILIEMPAWASRDHGRLARRTIELAMTLSTPNLARAIGSLESIAADPGARAQ